MAIHWQVDVEVELARFGPGEPGGLNLSFGSAAGAVVAFGEHQLGEHQFGQEPRVCHLLAGRSGGEVAELGVGRRSSRHAGSIAVSAAICSVMPRWRGTVMVELLGL